MHPSRELIEVSLQENVAVRSRRLAPYPNGELTFSERILILDELAEMGPLGMSVRFTEAALSARTMRTIEYASVRKLRPVVEIDVPEEGLKDRLKDLHKLDPRAVSFAIDDVVPSLHDSVIGHRSWYGSIYGAIWARDLGLPVEIRTLVRPVMIERLDRVYDLVRRLGAVRWRVDLVGSPDRATGLLNSGQTEAAYSELIGMVRDDGLPIELVEGPSFRRSLNERAKRGLDLERVYAARKRIEPRTSRGQLFITRDGSITPSRNLLIPVGDARQEEIRSVWTSSKLIDAIHDPMLLRGRCGNCELGMICGGSRARAWRVSADPLSSDPGCSWNHEHVTRARARSESLSVQG